MYYDHFGLSEPPFKITPNTDFFFSGGNRGPVLDALVYAITRGEGMVKVTGEVGSGKTMLCNMLQNRLPENVESVYLANPSVGPEEVLHAIAFELQLGLDRHADHLEVMHALQDYLLRRYAEGRRVVVFIEESQSMPLATLEEIRLLSNLETRNDKLLQIVLFGQPELDENLRRPEIRQLRDRITHSFRLQPLTIRETREYLTFRMRAAGYRGPEVFSAKVIKQIAKASSGLTRRINLVADKALLGAFSENTHTIHPRHIDAALRDSEFGYSGRWWARFPARLSWTALTVAFSAAVGTVTYVMADSRTPPAPAAVQTPPSAAARAGASAAIQTDAKVQTGDHVSGNPGQITAGVPPSAVTPAMDANGQERPRTPTQSPSTHAHGPSIQTAGSTAEIGPGDLIGNRMHATARWLKSGKASGFSIQLFIAQDEHHLRKHLNMLTKIIESDQLYLYRSGGQHRELVTVLWGNFPDRQSAEQEMKKLPAWIRANRPYLRTRSGIRGQVEQLQKSSG
jgi:MSHA biogenesis protein MshM